MINFTGENCYFVVPESKYGLSEIVPKYVTENSFTFCVKCKPDWDSMVEGEASAEGGLVMKNGQHMGIGCFVNGGQRYFRASLWVQDRKGFISAIEKHLPVTTEEKDKEYFITFRHDFVKKRVVIGNYNHYVEMTYNAASPIDYSNSWLWVGCANAFNSCAPEHRQYFRGDISFVSVHQEYLSDLQIKNIYGNTTSISELKKLQNENTVLFSNLEIKTPYKVFDDSDNGNHLIVYDEAWLDS